MKRRYLKAQSLLLSVLMLITLLSGTAYASESTEADDTRGKNIIFIGDSRTVGMHQIIGNDGNIWSGEIGMGLNWMIGAGVPAVESKITAGKRVVILMGVNDVFTVRKADEYNDYINRKAEKWTAAGAEVFYVSVNPITFDSVNDGAITNEKIEKWNELMQDGLSEQVLYIDTYSEVVGKLRAGDGLHYDSDSYRMIYNLILDRIEELEEYEYGRAWSRSSEWEGTKTDEGLTAGVEGHSVIVDQTPQITYEVPEEKTGFFAGIAAWFKNWWHSLFGE